MKHVDMDKYRELLLAKRVELMDRVRTSRDSETEEGTAEAPDLGDRALSTLSREMLYSLSAGERETLRLIDQSLDRMSDGSYGKCTNCGREIQTGRLTAVPWARHCIECQELQDRGEI